LLSFLIALTPTGALADTVELISGERVEGQGVQIVGDRVSIEVDGRAVSFERSTVRSIQLAPAGSPSGTPTPAQLSPDLEVILALKGLESLTGPRGSYSEYVGRVAEVKAVTEQYLTTPDRGTTKLKPLVRRVFSYHLLAAAVWTDIRTKRSAHLLIDQPDITECVPDRKARESLSASLWRGLDEGLKTLWGCASRKLAEVERLVVAPR